MKNLIPEIAMRGFQVDLLHVKNHGPYLDSPQPGVNLIELGSSHTYTSLLPLAHYLKKHSPQALLSDKDKVNRVALLAKKLAGVETRVCVRNGTTVSIDMQYRGWLDRKLHYWSMHSLYRSAHAILLPSQAAAEDLAHFANIDPKRVTAIPSPVVTTQLQQLAEQQPNHPWLPGNGTPLILGVGELGARKDFSTLIRAFAKVREKRPARLLILGKGRQHQQLEQLATELGVAEDVNLPGFIANPYCYLNHADLFVLSSKYEGSPVALMEAQGVGVPAVATDAPSGSREILDNGRYGKLCPVGDSDCIADAILETLDNPLPRKLLQQAAQRYSTKISADAYLRAMGFEVDDNN